MPKKRFSRDLQPKPRLHIICEGQKTEPNYFNNYIELKFPGTKLISIPLVKENTPVQLVEYAIKSKEGSPEDDIFWVVYDRESPTKYSNELHEKARANAESHGIKIAFSNVCFEVWILLHFRKTVAAYANYLELEKRSQLKRFLPSYDKGVKHNFTSQQVQAARDNAGLMNHQTKCGADRSWQYPYQWNPYTDIYLLLDAMDEFAKTNIS